MDDKKDLGELFKERLKDAKITPKDMLWADIEKTLDRKKRTRLYFICLASLLGLFLGGVLSVQIFTQETVKIPKNDHLNPTHKNTDTTSTQKDIERITGTIGSSVKTYDTIVGSNDNTTTEPEKETSRTNELQSAGNDFKRGIDQVAKTPFTDEKKKSRSSKIEKTKMAKQSRWITTLKLHHLN